MRKRHPINTNLRLHYEPLWNGIPVMTQRGPLVDQYLWRIYWVMWQALIDHPRTMMIRMDVRLPSVGECHEEGVLSRFLASLKAQIEADLHRKARNGGRVHPCRLRFVWSREQDSSPHPHFHVAIFVNRDAYNCLGDYRADEGNMAARIMKAMASAIGIPPEQVRGLVHFPTEAMHFMDANKSFFPIQWALTFKYLSYLAKAATKSYGNHDRHFGCSKG